MGSSHESLVSGQWYCRGFITFRVIHEVSNSWALFGYEASQVLNVNASQISVSDCYQINIFNATDLNPGHLGGKTSEELSSEAEGQDEVAERNFWVVASV